jgi:HK97 family phage prohead protease
MKILTQPELEKLQNEFGGERLVTLCDGSRGLRGGLDCEIKLPADAGTDAVVEFIASNDKLDRYDEVIDAKGWQLDNYKRNPVFQNSHKYGDICFTLGKSVLTEVRGNALVQRILFAVDINPIAKLAYDLYRQKFLNAVSVGFIPIRWETGSAESPYRRKYLEQELLELSAVSIPANPDALQLAVKAGAVDKSDLKELAEFLKQFCSKADDDANSRSQGASINGEHLQLARDVSALLKRV